MGGLNDEVFEVAYLDSGYKLLRDGIERLEEGTVDRATVYPRRIMEAALRKRASILIFAHNHPNGHVKPTEQDQTLTRALILSASPLQINVHDHLIVSKDEYVSQTLHIAAGEELPSGEIVLTPVTKPGTLVVTSSYTLAVLSMGGNKLAEGSANPSIRLGPGRHQITLFAPGVFEPCVHRRNPRSESNGYRGTGPGEGLHTGVTR